LSRSLLSPANSGRLRAANSRTGRRGEADGLVSPVARGIDRLLSGIGSVHSHWQGPTETALYVDGRTAVEMRAALQPFLDSYPLCERARVVQIAPASDGQEPSS
jgi:hypothetical protein